jgi:hypothetical protein
VFFEHGIPRMHTGGVSQITKFHHGQVDMNLAAAAGDLAQRLHQGRISCLVDIAADGQAWRVAHQDQPQRLRCTETALGSHHPLHATLLPGQ